jgi:hypothetical protein
MIIITRIGEKAGVVVRPKVKEKSRSLRLLTICDVAVQSV